MHLPLLPCCSDLSVLLFAHQFTPPNSFRSVMPRSARKTSARKPRAKVAAAAPSKANKRKSPSAKTKKHVPVKKRAVHPKYFVYRMKDGTDEFIAGMQKSDEFHDEYGTMVARKFEFTTKSAFEQHKKTIKIVTPTKGGNAEEDTPGKARSSGVDEPMTPEEQKLVAAAVQMITDSAPCNRFMIFHKTNGTAAKCLFVIRFLNSWGNDQWFMKPEHICVALKGYVTKFKQENKLVEEAIRNLDYGKRRDTKKGPEAAEVQGWESRDGARTNSYPLHVAHTFFTIPYEDLTSEAEEREIIENVATSLGETIRDIFLSTTFLPCFKAAVKHDGMWSAMMGTSYDPASPDDQRKKKKALTFMQYVKECKIRVKACQNLNTHLVLRDTQDLVTHLFNSRLKEKKYKLQSDKGKAKQGSEDEESGAESKDPQEDDAINSDEEDTDDEDEAPRTPDANADDSADEDADPDGDEKDSNPKSDQQGQDGFDEEQAVAGIGEELVPTDDESHAVREIYTDYPDTVGEPVDDDTPKRRGRGRPRNTTGEK